MPFLSNKALTKLYDSGLSMPEIAQKQAVSVHKVAYWFSKYSIKTRNHSEATYRKRNPNGDPFTIANIDAGSNKELLILGVALYLGEGTRRQKFSVRLANANPRIIRLFLRFLQQVCGVETDRVHAWINIFDDRIYTDCLTFWSQETGIPIKNFYAPTIRKRRAGTYKNRSKHGTITIIFSNKKLLEQLKNWCEEYLQKFADVA